MKIKNIYAAFGVILASGSLAFAETEGEALFNNILQAHAEVFAVDNVFTQDLNFIPWKNVFNKVAVFVDKNAGGNKKL